MAPPGFGDGLDTPRTNIGDATYLSRQPDFDMSQEVSFQSPSKDNNLLQQLRNGRSGGVNLRTPKGRDRAPLGDRRNLPAGIGGAEFTPMLKSATRNSARRQQRGKENGAAVPNTPALDRISEDATPIPTIDTSRYSNHPSYIDNTLPQVDTSSAASTPLVSLPRRGENKDGPLQDGNQLSLREQENVIDKIEKENFGLKLKIHFLEEALRKTGPEFNKEALKENTELKVDKVTMQRDLHKYKKHLSSAEKDLENYRQQMMQLQERAKKKYADEKQQAEIERLQGLLEDKDSQVEELQRQLEQDNRDSAEADKLRDEIGDLEADLREKDNLVGEYEDQIDNLKAQLKDRDDAEGDRDDEVENLKARLQEAEDKVKDAQRRTIELEQETQTSEELEEAKGTIEDLEGDIRRLEDQVEELQEKADEARDKKEEAENNLEELQEEMANKSVTTKGLTRQKEERLVRLQSELEQADEKYADLEKQLSQIMSENQDLKATVRESRNKSQASHQEHQALLDKVEELRRELEQRLDEKNILKTRHDALTNESASLQRDVSRLQKNVEELEESLNEEREHALGIEKHIRGQFQDDIERLNGEVSDLQAEVREHMNLYDNDSEKWETEKQTLESERDRAEDRAAGLQKTIDKLRETEGNLSDKETRLQEALQSESDRHRNEQDSLNRQIQDLQASLDSRQSALTDLRNELSATQDKLRQTQVDYQSQIEKIEGLEDEVEVLQTTLDEETENSREELQAALGECNSLRQQMESLRVKAESSQGSKENDNTHVPLQALRIELGEANARVSRLDREKQALRDELAALQREMYTLKGTLAETKADRDEVDNELKRLQQSGPDSGEDTLRVDRDRLELKTAKMRLDNEVRRLQASNDSLSEQKQSIERALDAEIDKATEEEERLNEEILELKRKLRESSTAEGQETSSSRRTIRELERRIKDYEDQLTLAANASYNGGGDGSSELSLVRRDLSAARNKEREYLEREAAHKDVVKNLKRQISDLERKAHDAEMSRLMVGSPNSSGCSAMARRSEEVSDLRAQLSNAHQSMHELRSKARESDRKVGQVEHNFQARLDALEDQKVALEQALEDAQKDAEDAAALHDKALRRLSQKLEKAERERSSSSRTAAVGAGGSGKGRDFHEALRQSQVETENLEHDILQQQEAIDALKAAEASLRRKLDRARSERAAYRLTAEKLQKDLRDMKAAGAEAGPASRKNGHLNEHQQQQLARLTGGGDVDPQNSDAAIDTVIRAAEGAEQRHSKELRGMALQMEWMQARWEREVSMRADAAYAKKFLQLELDVAQACNKAQLRELEQIRTEVLGSRRVLPPASSEARLLERPPPGRPTLRTVAIAARFVARMRIASRDWAKHEATRKKLADRVDEMRRSKRKRGLKVVREEEAGVGA